MSEVVPPDAVRFCIRCGVPLEKRRRAGKMRPVCPVCGWTYFSDPKVAVAAVVFSENGVLLVRRANPPRQGLWAFPAGFLDAGEDPRRAAERECEEETGLRVRVSALLDVQGKPVEKMGAHIVLYFRAEVTGGILQARDDVSEAAFFPPEALPPLAFEAPGKILAWNLENANL